MYGLWGLSAGLIPQNHQGSQNFVFFDVSQGIYICSRMNFKNILSFITNINFPVPLHDPGRLIRAKEIMIIDDMYFW